MIVLKAKNLQPPGVCEGRDGGGSIVTHSVFFIFN